MATAIASAQQTDVLGALVVTQLPLASGELACAAFGGDNTDDLYLVTLQAAVSRAYKVDQNGLSLITDSTELGSALCNKNGTLFVAGQAGTVNGQAYLTTLSSSGAPQAIVLANGAPILQIGSTLPGGVVVTSFRSQPVASDGPVVIVNETSDNALYRYDGTTWTSVPKPAGKWATYHVVGNGTQRDIYAEDGFDTIALFSSNATTTLFNSSNPPVADNPVSCCLTMTISPVDGTGMLTWGTGQNSYRIASFAPGHAPALIAQAGTAPDSTVSWANPTAMWPVNYAGNDIFFRGTSVSTDISFPNQQNELSFVWDDATASFYEITAIRGIIFLGSQQFLGFLPYGNCTNSQAQGIFTVQTTASSSLTMWGYLPRINAVYEDNNLNLTLETNLLPEPSMTVYVDFYGSAGPTPVTLEGNGVVTFKYPSLYTLGNHKFQIWMSTFGAIASSPWVLHDFGVATPPTIASFTAAPAGITAGQSATLSWSTVYASSVSIEGIGPVATTGTIAVSPTTTTTYTLMAGNSGATTTAAATVTVSQPIPAIASFTAAPAGIIAGQSATLSWSTVNASSVSIDQGIGPVATTGTIAVSPTATTTYTLTAGNSGATTTATATVTVTQPVPVPVINGIFSAAGITAQPLAPGGLFSIYGTNLCGVVADSPIVPEVVATVIPLPYDVGRCRVLIDGVEVPLLFGMTWNLPGRPAQINGQLPANLDPTVSHTAVVQLHASSDDSLVATSDQFTFTIQAGAPALFANLPTMPFIAQKANDYSLVSAGNPARPGDILILYGTGFGAYDKAVQDGNNAAGLLPSFAYVSTPVQAQVQITVNGQGTWVTAPTLYCVASPQFVGVTQCAIQIQIPDNLKPDTAVTTASLQMVQGTASTGSLSFAFSPNQ